jgi:hypothetical protein
LSNTLNQSVQRAAGTVDFDALSFPYDGSAKTITARIHHEPETPIE